jgi:hypothetical protein
MTSLIELRLSPRLAALVDACQKACVAECCGLEAFDFSPVHVASYLSAFSGRISLDETASLIGELGSLLEQVSGVEPDENGHVCSIAAMNQHFTPQTLDAVVRELMRSISAAPEMLQLSDRLRSAGV